MPMYACDLKTVFPDTNLEQVVEAASLTHEVAKEWAQDLQGQSGLELEEWELLLSEVAKYSLDLTNLARGEIRTLMKTTDRITERPDLEWSVRLDSGYIVFGEMEDFCIDIMKAWLNT